MRCEASKVPYWLAKRTPSQFAHAVADWHAVYTVYCDGSSATSARDDSPVPTPGGVPIWLRGFDVLQAWLAELELLGGLLSNATDVVLTGTSAGGMATYIHADFVRSKVGGARRR